MTETITAPKTTTTVRLAPRYRVLVHNDDLTPADFVVAVLLKFFKKAEPDAIAIMVEAHTSGIALVDVMGLEEAEFRVDQAHALSRGRGYPLKFSIEPE